MPALSTTHPLALVCLLTNELLGNFLAAILLGRFKNRLGNGAISSAATDVPGEPLGDLLPRGPQVFREQGFRRHDLPGRTIATLSADVANECLLQRIQFITLRYSFDGQH